MTNEMEHLTGDLSRGKTYQGVSVPDVPRGVPDMPDWLSDEAVTVWHTVTNALDSAGVLSEADGPLIAAYCEAVGTLNQATADVRERGLLIPSARGDGDLVKNPSVAMQRDAANTIRAVGAQLGLNPAKRRKRKTDNPHAGSDDPIMAQWGHVLEGESNG